jgi:predicted membrane protein
MSLAEHPLLSSPRMIVGVCLAIIGGILMLDRIGLVDAELAFRLWPAVIILIGAASYARGPERTGRTNGLILMAVGSWLLLSSIGVIRVGFWQLFWPMVLIGIGTGLVMQTLQHKTDPAVPAGADWVKIIAVMGGVNRLSASQRFRGGDIAAFMGGGRLDLRQAAIPPGEDATIDILTLMGGFEIFVPPNWVVATPAVPFLASIEDHRLPPVAGTGPADQSASPRLVLRGFLMMSGVHIRT